MSKGKELAVAKADETTTIAKGRSKGKELAVGKMVETKSSVKAATSSTLSFSKKVASHCRIEARIETTSNHPSSLDPELEQRFLELKFIADNSIKKATYLRKFGIDGSFSSKKVIWAYAAGLTLTQVARFSLR